MFHFWEIEICHSREIEIYHSRDITILQFSRAWNLFFREIKMFLFRKIKHAIFGWSKCSFFQGIEHVMFGELKCNVLGKWNILFLRKIELLSFWEKSKPKKKCESKQTWRRGRTGLRYYGNYHFFKRDLGISMKISSVFGISNFSL